MALSVPDIGSSAFSVGYQLFLAVTAVVVLAALFFGSRWAIGAWKKYKSYKITAIIISPDGTFYTKKIGKFKTKDGVDKMLFMGSSDTMPVIDTKYIRNNQVILWRYAIGQYALIPPRIWEKMDPKDFGIEVVNYQMKNFAFLEQRAAISRWAFVKDALAKWAPFITIIILCVTGGVIGWLLLKTALTYYNQAIAARILECKIALGTSIAPST